MDKESTSGNAPERNQPREGKLSYKFQRLRERIRQAIVSGELTGKLPGERDLAKRFKANPKTMGKALTDLAAEGLLDRSIGRGTYVHGSNEEKKPVGGRWLVLCDRTDKDCPVIAQFMAAHADLEVGLVSNAVRPSYINQFNLVIDLAKNTPDSLYRDLLVRGIPVLTVEKESVGCRTNAILLDRVHAVAILTREMVLAGHRRILVVEQMPDGKASQVARTTAMRYSEQVQIESCAIEQIPAITQGQTGAILCEWLVNARQIQAMIQEHPHLASLSVAATGICADEPFYTGVYLTPAELAAEAMKLLQDVPNYRPLTVWLNGRYVDRGSIHVVPERQFSGDSDAGILSA